MKAEIWQKKFQEVEMGGEEERKIKPKAAANTSKKATTKHTDIGQIAARKKKKKDRERARAKKKGGMFSKSSGNFWSLYYFFSFFETPLSLCFVVLFLPSMPWSSSSSSWSSSSS